MLNMKKNLLRNPCRRVHFLAKKSNQQCILYKDIKWLFAKSTNVFMRQAITSSIIIAIQKLCIFHTFTLLKNTPQYHFIFAQSKFNQ